MAEFTLHIRLTDDCDERDGERILEPYVTEYESVELGTDTVTTHESGVVVPEQSTLEIDGVETFAAVYTSLREEPDVHNMSLWGPSAERYPVPVQHYALQQIGNPELYEYHALDNKVTLVIADDELAAQEVQREVPDAALGYSESPF